MTPEKRDKLTQQLAEQGLTVLMTRDYDAILLQLARLAQFERLLDGKAESDKRLAEIIRFIRLMQMPVESFRPGDIEKARPLETLDVPTILTGVHKALHVQLDNCATVYHNSIHAATAAFIGILFRR
jgi:hypothetical protein